MPSYLVVATSFLALLLALLAGVYFSPYKDDVTNYMAERFFKAKAKAEEKALEHTGEAKAEVFLFVRSFLSFLLILSSPLIQCDTRSARVCSLRPHDSLCSRW